MAIALSVAFAATPLAADEKLVVWASPQVSQGINYIQRGKMKIVFIGADATASPANILSNYLATFGGVLISGKKIFIEAFVVGPNGVKSTPIKSSVIVT